MPPSCNKEGFQIAAGLNEATPTPSMLLMPATQDCESSRSASDSVFLRLLKGFGLRLVSAWGLTDNGSRLVQPSLFHKKSVSWTEIAVHHKITPFMAPPSVPSKAHARHGTNGCPSGTGSLKSAVKKACQPVEINRRPDRLPSAARHQCYHCNISVSLILASRLQQAKLMIMKTNRVVVLLLLLLQTGTINLLSQQTDVARQQFEEFKVLAEGGEAAAQYNLALCYYKGVGVAKDFSEATKWYRKAAEQGLVQAQYSLGSFYASGTGTNKNFAEAVNWYRKAAEQGHANAQYCLGLHYYKGYGVSKDLLEAVKWYRKAADQGIVRAQYNLGGCYRDGEGVIKDLAEAAKWYRKAADQGYANAQYELGLSYENGEGVAKNGRLAAEWYRKAAEQGDADAQNNIGLCYVKGDGVAEDFVEAHRWFNLASVQGDVTAKQNLIRAEKYMTTEQIAEAKRLAREFQPHKTPQPDVSELH